MPDLTPVREKRRLTKKDFSNLAAWIWEEYRRRKDDRQDLECQWDEIDRQRAMVPWYTNRQHGLRDGPARKGTEWMPFHELPWQAETEELLCADARRLAFPTDRDWFEAIAHDDDETLAAIEEEMAGQGIPVGRVSHDDLNVIVEAVHQHYQAMYDFRGVWDKLHADAFCYGAYAGRGLLTRSDVFQTDYRGVRRRSQKLPALIWSPIRNTYLDDRPSSVLRQGHMMRPATMFVYWQHIDDLRSAAKNGSSDPESMDGGWMPHMLAGIEGRDTDKQVQMLEYEGDAVFYRSSETVYVPNCLITVVIGQNSNEDQSPVAVVRYRFRDMDFGSYITQTYHTNGQCPYGTSPLMKGMPVQRAGSEAFSRMLQMAILKLQPPVKYDASNPWFSAKSGPVLEPNALWPTLGDVDWVDIGEPTLMVQMWQALKAEYQEVTGTTAPRLGQQTKSHQTAFAVDTELSRGVVRTVDFIRTEQKGAMQTYLANEYRLIRSLLGRGSETVFLPKYKGWVKVTGRMLPERVTYNVTGAAEPIEKREKQAVVMAAHQFALQAGTIAAQLGQEPPNITEMMRMIYEEAGVTDVGRIITPSSAGVSGAPAGGPAIPGANGQLPQDPLIDLGAGAAPIVPGM